MRKIFNILLFAILCLFCIMPEAMADTNYTANTTINIRAKADKNGKVLGKVQAGDTISVSSIEGDWAAIDFKGKTAYVSKEYITEAKQVAPLWLRIIIAVIGVIIVLYDFFKRGNYTLALHIGLPLILSMIFGDYVLWIAAFLFFGEAIAGQYAKHNYVSVRTKSGTLDKRIKNNVDEKTLRQYDAADRIYNSEVDSKHATGCLGLIFIVLLIVAVKYSGYYFKF